MLAGLRDIAWGYGNSLDPNAINKVPLSQLKVEFERQQTCRQVSHLANYV